MFDPAFQALLLIIAVVAVVAVRAKRVALDTAVTWTLIAGGILALALARDPFHAMRHLAWLAFLHVPLWSFVLCAVLWRERRTMALALGLVGIALPAIAVDAFLVEPHALEVTRYTIASSKVQKALRIAVMADIQTDHVGDYEREVFTRAVEQKPDLVLLAGDYLQLNGQAFEAERRKLQDLLRKLKSRFGTWAVEGNVEPRDWPRLFEGTDVHVFAHTQRELIDEGISITGLTLDDSFNVNLEVDPRNAGFNIVLGHAPDYSLGTIYADLLVAGHTHGGQVQLPVFGPPLTLSRVPRRWASGRRTTLPGNRTLIVSRGIGMERGCAPRLRFLCRPELVVIDVVPANAGEAEGPGARY